MSRVPSGVACAASEPQQLGAGATSSWGPTACVGISLVCRTGNVPNLASHEIRWAGRPWEATWTLDGCSLAAPSSRHGFGSCAFALASANSSRVQSVGIVGAGLGFRVGASDGDFHAGQGSPSALLDWVVSGGTHARVGGILRGQFHLISEKGGVGRRRVDNRRDIQDMRPGIGGSRPHMRWWGLVGHGLTQVVLLGRGA